MSKLITNVARKWTLKSYFRGAPQLKDFELVNENLPKLESGSGEILCKAEFLSVDPYMRPYSNGLALGDIMPGFQVARIVKSENEEYKEGDQIVGNLGWRDLTKFKPASKKEINMNFYSMPKMNGLPDSYALGALGLTGVTALYGLQKICKPKSGETLVVSSAAGAVGSLVGQIGKINGCKVLGFAGTDEKVDWLKNDLGFDHAFNYKKVELKNIFKEFASDGIDCYFDNVGGEFAYNVMRNMNLNGRIGVCGAIDSYNKDPRKPTLVPMDYYSLIYKQIKMEGFMVIQWANIWTEGLIQLSKWINEGKLKVRETVTDGFENMPNGFIEMLEGKNLGKAVIKA